VLGDGNATKDCYFGTGFFEVVVGNIHTMARRGNEAWGWGNNDNGELGDNTIADRSSPVSVVGTHSFVHIAVGSSHNHGLKSDGTAWGWGLNTSGQLGDDTITTRSSPVSVVGTHSFVTLCDGGTHSLGLKSDGTAWGWGLNSSGQLGQATSVANRSSPVSILGAHLFIALCGGSSHSLGLKIDGTAWTWGSNGSGELGDNTATNRSSPVSVVGTHIFITISAGAHSLALKSDGTAWAWGNNGSAALGDNTAITRSSPVSVVGTHSFIRICATNNTSYGLKSDGSLWGWGFNSVGQIGVNDTNHRSSPVSVLGGISFNILSSQGQAASHIAAGMTNANGATIWNWGSGTSGQLGQDTSAVNRSSPVSVAGALQVVRSIANIVAGDRFIWNGFNTGFNLNSARDKIDFDYST
jgi:alpha-tubulin suppressor-like RCC1 family protein